LQENEAALPFEMPQGWQPVASADWQSAAPAAAEPRTDGGAAGSRGYVRLGNARQYGHGIGLAGAIPVTAGSTYAISWQARVPSAGETFIIYLRVYDADGREVTTESPVPGGWSYSPHTQTHFEYLIGAPVTGSWTLIRRSYRVPERAVALRVALCLWRGEFADADCLELTEAPGPTSLPAVAPAGPLASEPRTASVCIDPGVVGAGPTPAGKPVVTDVVSGRPLAATCSGTPLAVGLDLTLEAYGTWVIAVEFPATP
jgi:hypothetical protein